MADLFSGLSTRWAQLLLEGNLILFLGAGANMTGRPKGANWHDGLLPNTRELTQHLAKRFGDPGAHGNLMRLAQYVEVAAATRPELEQHLRSAFDREPVPEPTSLHEFIAAIRRLAREHDRPPPAQILVTTNYDDALERAFEREGEPYDLLWYTTVSGGEGGEREGFFMHRPPSGVPVRYSRPNEDTSVNPNERPVILKLHGAVHRDRCASDSYVISEDDYIDYLGFIDVDALPLLVKQDMAERSYLFLGYGLGDWNLNVLLRRVWARRGPRSKLWAVQRSIADLDKQVWSCRHVEVFPADLTRWVEHVRNALVAALGEAP